MGRFARLAETMAKNAELDVQFNNPVGRGTVAGIEEFGTVELTADVIEALFIQRGNPVLRPKAEGRAGIA